MREYHGSLLPDRPSFQYTHSKFRKLSAFGGGTFESYSDEKDWWDHEHLQSFLDEGRPGIVVHYDETDCDGVYNEYKAAYGPRVSFICEDRGARAYRHFGP